MSLRSIAKLEGDTAAREEDSKANADLSMSKGRAGEKLEERKAGDESGQREKDDEPGEERAEKKNEVGEGAMPFSSGVPLMENEEPKK